MCKLYGLAACAVATCAAAALQTGQVMHSSFIGLAPFFIVYFVGGYLFYRKVPQD